MRLFGRIKIKILLRSFSFLSKRCLACGRMGKDVILNVDHVPPRRLYPEFALSNRKSAGAVRPVQSRQGKQGRDGLAAMSSVAWRGMPGLT
jgi:hypothetical protein